MVIHLLRLVERFAFPSLADCVFATFGFRAAAFTFFFRAVRAVFVRDPPAVLLFAAFFTILAAARAFPRVGSFALRGAAAAAFCRVSLKPGTGGITTASAAAAGGASIGVDGTAATAGALSAAPPLMGLGPEAKAAAAEAVAAVAVAVRAGRAAAGALRNTGRARRTKLFSIGAACKTGVESGGNGFETSTAETDTPKGNEKSRGRTVCLCSFGAKLGNTRPERGRERAYGKGSCRNVFSCRFTTPSPPLPRNRTRDEWQLCDRTPKPR